MNKISHITFVNLILAFAFFQQVLVINIGGSIRISDIICFIGGCAVIASSKKLSGNEVIILFLLFVISPLIGLAVSQIRYDDFNEFYSYFGRQASSLRYDSFLAPLIIYFYYILIFLYGSILASSNLTEENFRKLSRTFIFSGLIVCIYSIYGLIFVRIYGYPDLVPSFIDARNTSPISEARPSGFSSEAGDLSFMLVWALFLLNFQKGLFNKFSKNLLNLIFISIMIMTLSTGLLALVFAFFIYICFWQRRFLVFFTSLIIALPAIYYVLSDDLLRFVFYEKVLKAFEIMISGSEPSLSSAEIRGYHWFMGLELFKDNFIFGVGGGNSYFHLWRYDTWGMAELDGPKNIYIKMASELGVFGLGLLLLVYYSAFKFAFKLRNLDPNLASLVFISTLFFSIGIMALSTIYSLWMWVIFLLIIYRGRFELQEHTKSANN